MRLRYNRTIHAIEAFGQPIRHPAKTTAIFQAGFEGAVLDAIPLQGIQKPNYVHPARIIKCLPRILNIGDAKILRGEHRPIRLRLSQMPPGVLDVLEKRLQIALGVTGSIAIGGSWPDMDGAWIPAFFCLKFRRLQKCRRNVAASTYVLAFSAITALLSGSLSKKSRYPHFTA
jgi:hypothetical protein